MINKLEIPQHIAIANPQTALNMQKINELIDAITALQKEMRLVVEASVVLLTDKAQLEQPAPVQIGIQFNEV